VATRRTPEGLTPKQARFVSEYLIDLNASAAAVRAGYTPHYADRQGKKLVEKRRVQAAIAVQMAARESRTLITQDRVLQEIARVAFSNIQNVADIGPMGVYLKEFKDLPEDATATVSEAKQTASENGVNVSLKVWPKMAALELAGKHLGMFVERLGNADGSNLAGVVVYLPRGADTESASEEGSG